MENKRPVILRPVAWLFTCLAIFLFPLTAEYICKLGGFLVGFLDRFSTLVIIAFVLMFGSLYLSLFVYSASIIASVFVAISNFIYPTNHAFRFYFVGICLIALCAMLILGGILGFVSGGPMFWYYARYCWIAFASLMLMLYGKGSDSSNK